MSSQNSAAAGKSPKAKSITFNLQIYIFKLLHPKRKNNNMIDLNITAYPLNFLFILKV